MKFVRFLGPTFFRWTAGLSLVGLLILGGCTKQEGINLKITCWGDVQENAILSDLVSKFEKIHPDIHVSIEQVPYSNYVTKLLTQIVGGQAPDVVCVEVGNFTDFYLRGALTSLTPYVKADQFDLNVYYPKVVDRFSVDGQIYAIPRDTAPICCVYYNKNDFDSLGLPYPTDNWDLKQFVETAKKLTLRDSAGNVIRWGFVDDWVMAETWIYDFGGSYVDNVEHPTRWTFAEDPHTLEGVQFRSDLINKYKVMVPPSGVSAMGGIGNGDMFVNGRAAMFLSGIWKTPVFREIKKFKWDVAMLPMGPKGYRAFSTGGTGYGILKSSPHPKEAWELVKFVTGEQGEQEFASTGLAQPALMKVADSPAFLDGVPANKKMLLDAMKYVVYSPLCKNWNEVQNGIIGPELDKVWNDSETPKQAMEHLAPLLKADPPQVN